MRRSRLRAFGPVILLMVGGAYALASGNWCGEWKEGSPSVAAVGVAEGALRAGAATVEVSPPYPVVIAGYGPPRGEARTAALPLTARALVLEVSGVRVALVELDALTAPSTLVEDIRARVRGLGLGTVWVLASHSHSAMGGYDPRLVSELAGTGRFRSSCQAALATAGARALERAAEGLRPATLEVGLGDAPGLVSSRDEGQAADSRLTRIAIRSGGDMLAQIVIFGAHPTLVAHPGSELDPDYPGRLSAREAASDAGMTLVLQGAVGNARAQLASGVPRPGSFSDALGDALDAVPTVAVPVARLGFTRVVTGMPRPDASRLVGRAGWFGRAAGDNFLCGSAARTAEVGALRLGPVLWVSLPAEVTSEVAAQVEAATGAARVLSLANGYVGYVDTAARVKAGQGEAQRQYFTPQLASVFADAAAAATLPLRLPQ